MRLGHHGGTYCLFVGPWRIRWAGKSFRPLFSERQGIRPWCGIGRLKVRNDKWEPKKPQKIAR